MTKNGENMYPASQPEFVRKLPGCFPHGVAPFGDHPREQSAVVGSCPLRSDLLPDDV